MSEVVHQPKMPPLNRDVKPRASVATPSTAAGSPFEGAKRFAMDNLDVIDDLEIVSETTIVSADNLDIVEDLEIVSDFCNVFNSNTSGNIGLFDKSLELIIQERKLTISTTTIVSALVGIATIVSGFCLGLSFGGLVMYSVLEMPYDHAATEASYLTDWSAPPPWAVFTALNGVQGFFQGIANALKPPPIAMMDLAFGFPVAQILYAAAKLDIADTLVERPKTAAQIADVVGADAGRVERLLNACMGYGVFALDPSDPTKSRYVNSELSSTFRSDHPHKMKEMFLHLTEDSYDAWGYVYDAVKDASITPFEHKSRQNAITQQELGREDTNLWDWYGIRPENEANFQAAMTTLDSLGADAMAEDCIPLQTAKRVVDIGTSQGHFALRILQKYPHLTAVGMDLPRVVASIDENLKKLPKESQEAVSRFQWHGGSFFNAEDFPAFEDGDHIVMRYILHDWSDEDCVVILKNIRSAIGDKKVTLLIGESDIQDDPTPDGMAIRRIVDLHMMVFFNAGDRSPSQWKDLFDQAGWKMTNHYSTRSIVGWTEVVPN